MLVVVDLFGRALAVYWVLGGVTGGLLVFVSFVNLLDLDFVVCLVMLFWMFDCFAYLNTFGELFCFVAL